VWVSEDATYAASNSTTPSITLVAQATVPVPDYMARAAGPASPSLTTLPEVIPGGSTILLAAAATAATAPQTWVSVNNRVKFETDPAISLPGLWGNPINKATGGFTKNGNTISSTVAVGGDFACNSGLLGGQAGTVYVWVKDCKPGTYRVTLRYNILLWAGPGQSDIAQASLTDGDGKTIFQARPPASSSIPVYINCANTYQFSMDARGDKKAFAYVPIVRTPYGPTNTFSIANAVLTVVSIEELESK
jgi:hypothetical protein